MFKKGIIVLLFSAFAMANAPITGQVFSANGNPLAYAVIADSTGQNWVIADENGQFNYHYADTGDVLRVSRYGYQPDNLVICDQPENEAYLTKAPVLIFEILSKSTAHKDRTTKFNLYEREGVQYYVIVDPDNHVAKVYGLLNGHYVKVKDVSSESVEFDLDKCLIKFDFSKIWP